MNTNELLSTWSTLSLDEIEARLRAGTDDEALERLYGAEQVAEMRELAEAPVPRGLREAVVLMPGVMGSLLGSIRGVTTLTWINPVLFLKGHFDYLELSRDGTSDLLAEIETVPLSLERLYYTKIGVALRRQVDLYEFPYDWRRPIEWNADLLHGYLERLVAGAPGRQLTLVGHSMGGLVSRVYLARHPLAAERRVKRVVMHGTPAHGAAGTMEALLVGNDMMAIAAKLNKKNVTRRMVANMPSLYQLLPAPPNLFPVGRPYPANWDLYDAAAWRLEDVRQDYLDLGRQFHGLLAGPRAPVPLIQIAGCNKDTLVEVRRCFERDERPEYEMIHNPGGPDGGDGTVPQWSAVHPGARTYYVEESHRSLPRNKQVIKATLELIHGGIPDLPTALPARSREIAPRRAAEPVAARASRLRKRLEEGNATEEDLAQLYFL